MPSFETYHFEIRDLVAHFEDYLNNIVIRRYDQQRNVHDRIRVSLVWGHKQRVLHDIINKQGHIKLPVIAVTMGGLKRDVNRVFNKLDGSYSNSKDIQYYAHLQQPVPIDLTLNVSILARYQMDIDQILSNFIPYTDPYVVVSWRWPDPVSNKIIEIRSAVVWNENVEYEYPTDLQPNQPLRFVANTSFTVKGWLFKNPGNPAATIYKIDTTFNSVSEIYYNYDLMKSMMYQDNTETLTISAKPFITSVLPSRTITNQETPIIIKGKMLDYVGTIYVSGHDGMFDDTEFFEPLKWNSSVSGDNPGFTGILIKDWRAIDKNNITMILPPAKQIGRINLILVNEAGYGNLINDTSSMTPSITSFRFEYENGINVYDVDI